MGAYSHLYIAKSEILTWKYEDCPPILAMIFEPEEFDIQVERQAEATEENDANYSVQARFQSTVSKVAERLRAKGLPRDRVKELARATLDLEFNPEAESESADSDPDFIIEISMTQGVAEMGELLVLWHALEEAKPTDSVVFDSGDTLDYVDTVDEVLNRDFLLEARNKLRQRLHLVGALLDFVRRPTPEALKYVARYLAKLSEDDFLGKVVVPVLQAEGYDNVKAIDYHGPNEFGSDTRPMRERRMGKWFYMGAQAKAAKIDQAEATHAATQIDTALTVVFSDPTDNLPKRLGSMFLFLGQGATAPAMTFLTQKYPTSSVRVFDASEIAELVLKHDLLGNLI